VQATPTRMVYHRRKLLLEDEEIRIGMRRIYFVVGAMPELRELRVTPK